MYVFFLQAAAVEVAVRATARIGARRSFWSRARLADFLFVCDCLDKSNIDNILNHMMIPRLLQGAQRLFEPHRRVRDDGCESGAPSFATWLTLLANLEEWLRANRPGLTQCARGALATRLLGICSFCRDRLAQDRGSRIGPFCNRA